MPPSAKALGKRKAEPDSDFDSPNESDSDALALLNVQGQAFLQSFGSTVQEITHSVTAKKKSRTREGSPTEEEDEEWGGLELETTVLPPELPKRAMCKLQPEETSRDASNVVVFSEPCGASSTSISKRDAKALMSSKVHKIHSSQAAPDGKPDANNTEEQSLNLKDKELFRLLHTRLLAGTTDSAVHQTNGDRRRALEGRVIELSGKANVGHGLKVLHHQYKVHQPKRTRDIIKKKEKATDTARRAEFEENGIFHKDNKKSMFLQVRKHKARPRLNGISEGIGKYKDGTLTLSKADIASITGTSSGGGSKKGGGRKRK
ncbi:hypothetical protein FRB90_009677 [Tulasnella sp. 427]|nr:hypothetical protein FRB90_009677 [Tulasnella sp. 427]